MSFQISAQKTINTLFAIGVAVFTLATAAVALPGKTVFAADQPDVCSSSNDLTVKFQNVQVASATSGNKLAVQFNITASHPAVDTTRGRILVMSIYEQPSGGSWSNIATSANGGPLTLSVINNGTASQTSYLRVFQTQPSTPDYSYVVYAYFADITTANCSDVSRVSLSYQGGNGGNTDVNAQTPPCPTNVAVISPPDSTLNVATGQAEVAWDFSWPKQPANASIVYQYKIATPDNQEGFLRPDQFSDKKAVVQLLDSNGGNNTITVLALNKTANVYSSGCSPITVVATQAAGAYGWTDQSGNSHGTGLNTSDTTGPQQVSDYGPLGDMIGRQTGFVYQSWQAVRVVINILLILALLAISFSNILRINIDSYAVKKALPNLIIGVILSNASFVLIKFLADIASATVFLFVNLSNTASFADFIKQVTNTISATTAATLIGGTDGALAGFLKIVFGLVSVVGLLWLAVILYVRLVYVYVLTILSPLAFLTYGIPGFEKYFKQWWQMFIKWMFMLTALSAVFWMDYEICVTRANQSSWAQTIVCYVLFFVALTIPSKFGGKIVDNVTGKLKQYSGYNAAGKAIGDNAKLYGRAAGSWASEKVGLTRYKEWSKLNKQNIENRMKERDALASKNARIGRAGRREAYLKHLSSENSDLLSGVQENNSRNALSAEMAKRLNRANVSKTTAEKLRQADADEKRMKFLYDSLRTQKDSNGKDILDANGKPIPVNKEMYDLIQNLARANSESAAIADALKSTEDIEITGNYTNNRQNVLRLAARKTEIPNDKKLLDEEDKKEKDSAEAIRQQYGTNSSEYRKAIMEYNQHGLERAQKQQNLDAEDGILEAQFEKEKGRFTDMAAMTIEGVAQAMSDKTLQGRIWKAELAKQAKSYNKGVSAQQEDMVENGNVVRLQADDDFKKFFQQSNAAMVEKMVKGVTTGLEHGDVRSFDRMAHTLKKWMSSNRNPNYNDAVASSLRLLVEQGKQEIVYMKKGPGKNSPPVPTTIHAGNVDDYIRDLATMNQNEKQNIVSAINKNSAFSGSPSNHISTGYTP